MGIRCRSRKNKGQAVHSATTTAGAFSYHAGFSSILDSVQIWSYLVKKCNSNALTSRDLEILKFMELVHIIPRQKVQDSIYTYSRNDRVCSELLGDEIEGGNYFIVHCSLPIHDREQALQDLSRMEISHASLFPDEEQIRELKKLLLDFMRGLCDFNISSAH